MSGSGFKTSEGEARRNAQSRAQPGSAHFVVAPSLTPDSYTPGTYTLVMTVVVAPSLTPDSYTSP